MVAAYRAHMPGRVAAETNMGGQLVASVLHTVDPLLSLTTAHAARSKPARAEPVSALYEPRRANYVGLHVHLEEQLCSWTPGEGESPDRLDPLVWALTSP